MAPASNPEKASGFLTSLWAGKPPTTAIQLWEKRNKKTYTFTDIEHAGRYAAEQAPASDVYMAAGLAATAGKPRHGRADSVSIVAIPGLWVDLDINGGPNDKANGAATVDDAIALAGALLEPTLLVASGYGIQAWWLFDDPWVFTVAAEREQAARLSAGFVNALRAEAHDRSPDWKLDGVFDLARLMRVPGTINHKGAGTPGFDLVPVEQLDHDGPRHGLEALQRVAAAHMQAHGNLLSTLTGAGVDVNLNGSKPPGDKLMELQGVLPDFDAVWNHRDSAKTATWSLSEFDLSIATFLVQAGFDDQEIADSLRYHRQRFGDASGKGERLDYLKRTIGKARGGEQHEQTRREAEYERNDAIAQLGEAATADAGTLPSVQILSRFNTIVGGPEIKELVQEGRDPENHRVKLVLANGDEIQLGMMEGLLNQGRFGKAFSVVTHHWPRPVKASKDQPFSWNDLVNGLLKHALVVHEDAEDSRAATAREWVSLYCDRRISTDHNAACETSDPFERGGYVHVHLKTFARWLAKVHGERLERIDLKLMLKAAGFERHTMNYVRQDGSHSTRSYYRAPAELLAGDQADQEPGE